MPIGSLCRTCGAKLSGDVGWCARCLTPVTPFAARPPLHEQGSFVANPRPDVRMSRWRSGPTTLGPLGRIGWTVGLLLFAPWWALAIPMRSIDDAPPTPIERFRARHPSLGREIRLGPTAKLAIVTVAAIAGVVVFLAKDDVDRYLFAAPILVVGLMVALAKWNDV
jgi:hypothetical protein